MLFKVNYPLLERRDMNIMLDEVLDLHLRQLFERFT